MTHKRTTRRSYGGESAEDRLARRRQQMLDAGLELFGTQGYRSTTVRQICREAKVADRYFYECFDHMEDLLVAVFEECDAVLLAAIAQAAVDAPAEASLRDVVTPALDAFFTTAQDTRLARVIWTEVLGVSERVERIHQEGMEKFAGLLLELASSRGVIPGAQASPAELLIAQAAVGGISQVATAWRLSGYAAERSDVVSAATRFLLSLTAALDERKG